jgi:threonine/homoserine/homoserine lactone efflux protein
MDIPAILVKITGFLFLAWTVWSIFRHFKSRKTASAGRQPAQSVTEQILNNALLYLWLAFMLAFSAGMIINN